MTSNMEVFFRVRDDVYEHYGIDPWYLVEDRMYTYWFKDNRAVYFCEDKADAIASLTDKEAEYVVAIAGNRHINIKEVEKDGLYIVAVDDDRGGDPYYMVFDLKHKVGDHNEIKPDDRIDSFGAGTDYPRPC
jgi:hypothetical protein